jgi:hypothetical protein
MAEPSGNAAKPGYALLRQVGADTWQMIGEVDRRPGLPARRSRAQAVIDGGGAIRAADVVAVLPRSEWRVALDHRG